MRLILVGDGPALSVSVKLAATLGLDVCDLRGTAARACPRSPESQKSRGPVVFCGSEPNAAACFREADVGILLSTEPEAFGIVLLEAMSRRRPLIASRIGGIPEVITDGETGLLVDPGDVDAAARAIQRLAESPDLCSAMGEAGYVRWKTHFQLARMEHDYLHYFESLAHR